MSRVYFHSQTHTSEAWGADRAYFASICQDMFLKSMALDDGGGYLHSDGENHPMWYVTRDNHYSKHNRGNSREFVQQLSTALNVCFDRESPIQYFDGKETKPVPVFHAMLNTAIALGSDVVKLMARIHGQCEVHGYVEEPNREWLAGIIQQGIDLEVFRDKEGWSEVIEHLNTIDDGPVVMSYSVCSQFPSHEAAEWGGYELPMDKECPDEPDYEKWWKKSDKTRWKLALKGIRSCEGLELKPDDWQYPEFHFGEPITGFQIFRGAIKKREEHPDIIAKRAKDKWPGSI